MSLINDQQRKNSQQQQPIIKPLPTPATTEQYEVGAGAGTGQEFQLTEPQPALEVTQEPESALPSTPSAGDFSLAPDGTEPKSAFTPQQPVLAPTSPGSIWQTVPPDQSPYSPEVLRTSKPTVYDSSRINTDSQFLDSLGRQDVNASYGRTIDAQREAALEAQKVQQRMNDTRRQSVNIPTKSRPFYAGVGEYIHDVLFGNKLAQEQAEKQRAFNPLTGQFGVQGAGLGGLTKYALSIAGNIAAGAVADTAKLGYQGAKALGFSEEQARAIGTNTVINSIPGGNFASALPEALKQQIAKLTPQFDWQRIGKRSSIFDAIFAQAQVSDLNDPKGNNKSPFYREQRVRRPEPPKPKTFGQAVSQTASSIGQAIVDDPVGAAWEIGYQLFNPFDNAVGDVVSAGLRTVFRAKKAAEVAEIVEPVAEAVSKPPAANVVVPKKPLPALKPGKVEAKSVEEQLQEFMTPNIPDLRPQPQRRLPGSVEIPVSSGQRALLPAEGAYPRVQKQNAIVPSNRETVDAEFVDPVVAEQRRLPGTAEDIREAVEPAQLNISQPRTQQSLPAGKQGGSLVPSEAVQAEFIEDSIVNVAEDLTKAPGTRPTKVVRVLTGDYSVLQSSLDPVLPDVWSFGLRPEDVLGTPAEIVLRVGLGNPSENRLLLGEAVEVVGFEKLRRPGVLEERFRQPATTATERLSQLEQPPARDVTETVRQQDTLQEFAAPNAPELPEAQLKVEQQAVAPEVAQQANVESATPLTTASNEVQYFNPPNLRALSWQKPKLGKGKVVRVNPQKLDEYWRDLRVDQGGKNGIGNRYNEAKEFLNSTNDKVNMSEVVVQPDGSIVFVDGRHRMAVLRDLGYTDVPVLVQNRSKLPDSVLSEGSRKASDAPANIPNTTGISKRVEELSQPKQTELPGRVAKERELLEAQRQLAAQKAILQAPLKKLDEVFDTTVDFGRKNVEEVPMQKLTSDAVFDALENNIPLRLPRKAYDTIQQRFGRELADAVRSNDYNALVDISVQKNLSPMAIASMIAKANNSALEAATATAAKAATEATKLDYTLKFPAKMMHGSALKGWTPNYSLVNFGSRGELGSGLYLTNRKTVAEDYASAIMGENLGAEVATAELSPAIHTLSHSLTNTLSARAKLPSNSEFVNSLLEGLPDPVRASIKRSLQRDKTTTYTGLLNKLEAALPKSGLEPTEEVLRSLNNTISDNLRKLGYDSVYDSKSGFGLVLDESKVKLVNSLPVPAPSPMQAMLARYNADAYAAKFYNERLTTDANLRDSAYKLYSQLENSVDKSLADVQQELIRQGLNKQPDSILPPKSTFKTERTLNDARPETVEEMLSTVTAKADDSPCTI